MIRHVGLGLLCVVAAAVVALGANWLSMFVIGASSWPEILGCSDSLACELEPAERGRAVAAFYGESALLFGVPLMCGPLVALTFTRVDDRL
jgi:hypothetical protein